MASRRPDPLSERGLLGPEEALSLVWREGVMLASAKGPTPSLAEIVVGEPIGGSWCAHRDSRQIFSVVRFLERSHEFRYVA